MTDTAYSDTLADFFMAGRSVDCTKGQIVLSGDDQNPGIYFIAKGFIRVYSINDDGEEYTHVIYKNGDIFPLIWALKDMRRHIFYESMNSSVLWIITKETLVNYLKENSSPVSYALIRQLTDQFNVYADRLDNLEYKSAYERVVYRLLFLAGRFGKKTGKTVVIEAPITHKVIAQTINLARESVSRELEKLTAKGLVDTQDGYIVIKDVDKLSQEFSEPVTLDLWGLQ